jgi:hypothetical protein
MDILELIDMKRIISLKLIFICFFSLFVISLQAQTIISEKAKIHINSTITEVIKPPDVQIISPEGLTQGITFQATKQSLTIGLRVLNKTENTRIFINNIEIPFTGAGDVLLKDIELKNGSNSVMVTVREKDKLIMENVYSMLYIPSVKNISPYVLNPGKFYALIIANSNYISPEIPPLARPIEDAKALRQILLTKYTFDAGNIYFLQDMKRAKLIMALDELLTKLTPEDNLLIYYAGHGKMDEESGRGYWLLADAVPSSRVDWFSNSNLTDYIKSYKAKHILLIADACFAGSIFYARSVFDDAPPPIQDIYKNKSRTAMTSGGTTEVNDDSKFSEMLIMHLKENTNQFLTSSQLFREVENAVMKTNSTAPRFGIIEDANDMHGDFVFILREK